MPCLAFALAAILVLTEAYAKDSSYLGSVHVMRGATAADAACGTVFLDADPKVQSPVAR